MLELSNVTDISVFTLMGHLTLNMGLFLAKNENKAKVFNSGRHLYIKSVYNYLGLRESEI